MEIEERLKNAALVVSEAGLLDEVEPDELVDIMSQTDVNVKDMPKLAGTIVYIRKRFLEGMSRVKAFKVAFPLRSIPSGTTDTPYINTGSKLGKTTIDIKAKRLEQSKIYKKVVALLQTSLYVSFALERIEMLDEARTRVYDEDISHRDRVQYMKMFFEETRKPEANGMELNVNVQNNEVNLVSIEQKLGTIADRMVGSDADMIIEALNVNSTSS
jgi:hypothetical protein